MTLDDIVSMLAQVLATRGRRRRELLATLDNLPEPTGVLWEYVYDLANDVAYYEPDADLRREDSSLFGDDRLEVLVKETLLCIEKARSENPPA